MAEIDDIKYEYKALPNGAQIHYSTEYPQYVQALHEWFDAQVSEHGNEVVRNILSTMQPLQNKLNRIQKSGPCFDLLFEWLERGDYCHSFIIRSFYSNRACIQI